MPRSAHIFPNPSNHPTIVLLGEHPEKPTLRKGIADRASELHLGLISLMNLKGGLPRTLNIIGGITGLTPEHWECTWFRKHGLPLVGASLMPDLHDEYPLLVTQDISAQGRLAAEFFAQRNFQQLAYIGNKPVGNKQALCASFRHHAERLGCTFNLLERPPFPSAGEGSPLQNKYAPVQQLILDWIHALPKPVGLLAYHDNWASSLCVMLMENGIQVPEEVCILGIGNDDFICDTAMISISSIDVDHEEIGRRAVQLLYDAVHEAPPAENLVVVPPRGIVERESTNALAISDPRVRRAVRYLWDHLKEDIQVADVAKAVAVAPTTLERAFRKQLERGIHAELRRKRIEALCHLLRTTKATLPELAPEVGFRSLVHLHRCFKQATGMTPRQYRIRAEPTPT